MTALPDPAYRLIPSRFPPIQAFEDVASPEDLEAAMELEGWTNDRLVAARLARLPREEWVFGTPNASVVMAAFLHGSVTGSRFSSPDLGAWYAALSLTTAAAEVAHQLRREALNTGRHELRQQFRSYVARLDGDYRDIRGQAAARPDLYAPDDYTASQAFGEAVRAAGGDGIVYDSVRHAGGTCVVAYRPRNLRDVVMASHYEIIVPRIGRIVVRQLN